MLPGLEADYVVIANLTRGTHGFPSEIADDPVLNLVMTEPDGYPHAEERRLFTWPLPAHGVGLCS